MLRFVWGGPETVITGTKRTPAVLAAMRADQEPRQAPWRAVRRPRAQPSPWELGSGRSARRLPVRVGETTTRGATSFGKCRRRDQGTTVTGRLERLRQHTAGSSSAWLRRMADELQLEVRHAHSNVSADTLRNGCGGNPTRVCWPCRVPRRPLGDGATAAAMSGGLASVSAMQVKISRPRSI